MDFEIITLFPELVQSFIGSGLVGKAVENGLVRVFVTNPRDFTQDRHRTVDDQPYGGGAGMVIKPEPIAQAIAAIASARGPSKTILLSPSGKVFDQSTAVRLSGEGRVTFLCGRYEGIDDRIREEMVDEVLSLGDFVLNGGEIAALAMIEAIARLRDGFMGNSASTSSESFRRDAWGPLLEYPQYTRPATWRGAKVPEILLAGDHKASDRWREQQSVIRTWQQRPELRARPVVDRRTPPLLAVEFEPGDSWSAWQVWASAAGCELVGVARSRAAIPDDLPEAKRSFVFRDLRELRRSLRKRQERQTNSESPILGVIALVAGEGQHMAQEISFGESGAASPLLSPSPHQLTIALDLVRVEASRSEEPPAGLTPIRPVFWLPSSQASRRSPHAAPISQLPDAALLVPADFVQNHLAIGSQMTDSSQPKSPTGDRFALALWALERLDREDLTA